MSVEEARAVVSEYLAEMERVYAIPEDDRGPDDYVMMSMRLGIAQNTLLLAATH